MPNKYSFFVINDYLYKYLKSEIFLLTVNIEFII
jgi:hypothetical protein